MSSGSRIYLGGQDNNGFEGINLKTSDHTLESEDVNHLVEVDSTSAVNITIPNETSFPFTGIKIFTIARKNTGQVFITIESGVVPLGGIDQIADTATVSGGMITITHTGVNTFYTNGKEI